MPNLKGDKGVKGAPGQKGARGPPGPEGPPTYEIELDEMVRLILTVIFSDKNFHFRFKDLQDCLEERGAQGSLYLTSTSI